MKRSLRSLPLLLLAFAALPLAATSACGKKGGKTEKEAVKWPDAPKGDVPLVVEFQSMDKTNSGPRANLRVFNFTQKPVRQAYFLLHYFEGAKEIKDFPQTQIGRLPDGKDWEDITASAFIPDECTKVTAEVREVEYQDGTSWKAPKKAESTGKTDQ